MRSTAFIPALLILLLTSCQEQKSTAPAPTPTTEPVIVVADSTPAEQTKPPKPTVKNTDDPAQWLIVDSNVYKTYWEHSPREKIKIDIVSFEEFMAFERLEVNFADTTTKGVQYIDTIIHVPLKNGQEALYENLPDEKYDDEMKTHSYLGHFDFLDAYLIAVSYWEGSACFLYSAKDGNAIAKLVDYPVISPDKKHIISMWTNPYEQCTDFQLFSVQNGQVQEELNTNFSKWMVAFEPLEVFWTNDSTLMAKVRHSQEFWNDKGQYSKAHQYLKITVL